MIILHCTKQNIWNKESQTEFFGNTAIETENSIKCIEPTKINAENFSFPSTLEHTILCINTDSIKKVPSKMEGDYIHFYEPIPISAIIATIPYTYDSEDKFIMSKDIQDIIYMNEIIKKLDLTLESFKYFKDGTDSRIFAINGKYIVKQNIPELLKSEYEFSKTYEDNSKLQHVVLIDDAYNYIVYEYIPGDVMHTVDNVEDLIFSIKRIIDSYKNYNGTEFGYIYNPSTSWSDFLKSKVHEASLNMPDSFDFLPHVYESISTLEHFEFTKKLIHGDFGTHNFIKKNGDFVGAIDPIPLAGDPLYDFIFSVLSNIDIVKKLSIDYIVENTNEPEEKVKAMLIILLFCRMSTCLKHHKEDFDSYVDFWYTITAE